MPVRASPSLITFQFHPFVVSLSERVFMSWYQSTHLALKGLSVGTLSEKSLFRLCKKLCNTIFDNCLNVNTKCSIPFYSKFSPLSKTLFSLSSLHVADRVNKTSKSTNSVKKVSREEKTSFRVLIFHIEFKYHIA